MLGDNGYVPPPYPPPEKEEQDREGDQACEMLGAVMKSGGGGLLADLKRGGRSHALLWDDSSDPEQVMITLTLSFPATKWEEEAASEFTQE